MSAGPEAEGVVHFTGETPARRLARHALDYAAIATRALQNRVPASQLVRTQRPFALPDAEVPPVISVEFTNECQLRCVYCDNRLRLMPRGFMSRGTFASLVESVREMNGMVKIVGNGECTLHPECAPMIRELAGVARHLYVLTNGHWPDTSIVDALLCADVVGFSIDAGTREEYERSRVGGSHDRLLANVRALNEEKRRRRAKTLIVVRLMLRPSQRDREKELIAQWRPYASAVFRQHIFRMPRVDDDGDVYTQPDCTPDFTPRCGSPFRDLDVDWTGNVPLCSGSARQVGSPGFLIGNVNETSLRQLWNGPIMRQYRAAIRAGETDRTPVCRGCTARY